MIFLGCAVLSIVIWLFNWVCWLKKYCCFKVCDEYSNKCFVWWLSWIFLLGIFACCIAGFVTANRLGFASYGVQCAYERIYDDTIYGQVKSDLPRWDGINNTINYLDQLKSFFTKFNEIEIGENYYLNSKQNTISDLDYIYPVFKEFVQAIHDIRDEVNINKILEDANIFLSPAHNSISNIYYILKNKGSKDLTDNIEILKTNLENIRAPMNKYKSEFIDDFEYYVHLARGVGQILPIVYFAILLTFVVFACSLLIILYCNYCSFCDQGCNKELWIFPMHITWNVIRFFIFSFFIFGMFYGMLFLAARDGIAYIQYAFSKENFEENTVIIPKETKDYFSYCLYDETFLQIDTHFQIIDNIIGSTIQFENWKENDNSIIIEIDPAFKKYKESLKELYEKFFKDTEIEKYQKIYKKTGSIYSGLNCSFIENDLNLLYRAMWDLSWESRVLCALSCCIGFFGAIAIYGFLWSFHLWGENYNNNNKNNNKNNNNNKGKFDYKPPSDIITNNYNPEPKLKKNRNLKKPFIPPPRDLNNNNDYNEMKDKYDENEEEETED